MAQEKTLRISPASWSDEAAQLLAQSEHDPLIGVGTLQQLIAVGRAELFEVIDGGALAAAYVLQGNQCEKGSEVVIVAAGARRGYGLTRVVIPYIESQAAPFDRVRVSASRPGMGRLLERMGYARMAVTYVPGSGNVSRQ
jgi:hypothetical protein